MLDTLSAQRSEYIELTATIVSAYVSNNHVRAAELPAVLARVHAALQEATSGKSTDTAPPPAPRQPSRAEIERSITPEVLISFEDGKSYKTLKRHLTALGLSPERYRVKWSLPADYPMVAPAYSQRRSQIAHRIGLGLPSQDTAAGAVGDGAGPQEGRIRRRAG